MGIMFYVWLIIMVAAVIIEIATTDLTSFWFAIGAVCSMILSVFIKDDYIWVQVLLFAVVSFLAILIVRPILKRKLNVPKVSTNVEAMLGKIAVVTTDIKVNYPGSIKIEGIEWTALTEEDEFEIGDLVEIEKLLGNKVLVKKYKGESV